MDSADMTDLGAGGAAGAFILVPDKLVAPNPARGMQTLLRILHRNRVTEEVLQSNRQASSDTDTITFKLQLGPILT